MPDPLVERLRRASVFIRSPDGSTGSGYLVAPQRIATALHVVRSLREGGQCEVSFPDGVAPRAIRARLLNADAASDAAILAFDETLAVQPLPVAAAVEREQAWLGYGFPALTQAGEQPPAGLLLDGQVQDAEAGISDGAGGFVRALLLYGRMFAAGNASPLHGFSGSPVVVGGALVGHLTRHIGDPDDRVRAAYGCVYACPIEAVVRLLGPAAGVPARAVVAAAAVPPARASHDSASPDECVARIRDAAAGHSSRIEQLLQDWRRTGSSDNAPDIAAAEVLVSKGEFARAQRVLRDAPPGLRVEQLLAFVISKSGGEGAIERLKALRRQGHGDAETLGLLAGSYKRQWLKTDDSNFARSAYEVYSQAFQQWKDSFNGINAAAMALHCGAHADMRLCAQQVVDALAAREAFSLDHWECASLAEGLLLLGRLDEAATWYLRAAGRAVGRHQDIASMRRQARLDLRALGRRDQALDACLPVPAVLVYFGHRIDAPDRAPPRFPAEREPQVRQAIAQRLRKLGPLHGFGCAAGGADLLFVEALVSKGGTATVVLPFPAADFVSLSVDGNWRDNFDEALAAPGVTVVEPLLSDVPDEPGIPAALARTNREIMRRAIEFAAALDQKPIICAVWDGRPGDGPGGTADAAEKWRRKGYKVERIDPLLV